jgi:hypothetical protein
MRFLPSFIAGLICISSCPKAEAQARIWTIDGNNFPATITAYQDSMLTFTRTGSWESESAAVSFLKKLQFEDGRVNRFRVGHIPPDWKADTLSPENLSAEEKRRLAWLDVTAADQFLPGRNAIFITTSLASPAATLIPVFFVANIGPHPRRYETAHPSLLKDPDYLNSFRKAIKKKKRKETAEAYVFGTGVFVAFWTAIFLKNHF